MRNMIGAVFMIVKIFCAVLVVLGVSVAIVLGGLIILASCVSGRKKPAGDNTADDRGHIYVHKLYAGILPITFSTLPRFLYSIQKVESDLPISILHFCIPFYSITRPQKKLLTQPETCAILSTKSNETTRRKGVL